MLCETCTGIDIRRLLTKPVADDEVALGTWPDIQSRSAYCELCSVVAATIRYGPWNLKGNLSDGDEFLLLPKLTATLHWSMAVDSAPCRIYRLQVVNEEYEDAGDILLHADDAHMIGQAVLGHGRAVSAVVNLSLIHI